MTRILDILAPTRYPWRFNSPRQSRHRISIRNFLPLNKICSKIEGVTVFNPLPPKNFDLIHAFNRIPIGKTPYVIGFESHLPRGFGIEHTAFFRAMSKSLVNDRCRGIVAISHYAYRQCLNQHKNFPWYDDIKAKLSVRYPNINIPKNEDALAQDNINTIRILFVGNHFARKGGLVALRLAQLAHQRNLPIAVDIISSLQVGAMSWIDPLTKDYFTPYKQLIETLPNVTHHGALPNAQVIEHIRQSHFLLLPTFSDTFGFSAIEAMSQYTPVIATSQCAMPEFINNNNGILLPLEVDECGEWVCIKGQQRNSSSYAALYDDAVLQLAQKTLEKIEDIISDRTAYMQMRTKARNTAENLFSSTDANKFWDDYYCKSLNNL